MLNKYEEYFEFYAIWTIQGVTVKYLRSSKSLHVKLSDPQSEQFLGEFFILIFTGM